MMRTFDDRPATRESTPLLVGLAGPSGSGKTFSALLLATGIQQVSGGEIFVIDTEARRALHYADRFKFRHLSFGAPFSPLDYREAIEHCVKKGAKTIVIDSMSHEHSGQGGVLEWHEAELDRMSRGDDKRREKMTMAAWIKPKAGRMALINFILQQPINFVFCFRAKEKVEIRTGKDPVQLGFMPIAGDEYVYEMTLMCVLPPGSNGVPSWTSEMPGERQLAKLPEQFRQLFANRPQLTADIGRRLAQWAAGGTVGETATPPREAPRSAEELIAGYGACSDAATFRALEDSRKAAWPKLANPDRERIKSASDATGKRIAPPAIEAEERKNHGK